MWKKLKQGQIYMRIWPLRKALNPIFPENRVIKATQFGSKMMPAFACILLAAQWIFTGMEYLPPTLITALFALSLPMQGIFWLGNRALTPLPSDTLVWYYELQKKLEAFTGKRVMPKIPLQPQAAPQPAAGVSPMAVPRYYELALLLKQAFDEADKNGFEFDL